MPTTMFLPHYVPPAGYGVFTPAYRTAQGKVAELRIELNSGGKKDKNHAAKKIALKKIVANMTMSNNDMVALFPEFHLRRLPVIPTVRDRPMLAR